MRVGSLNIMDIAKEQPSIGTLTVDLRGMRRFRLQNAIGKFLIRAGISVLAVNLDLKIKD